MAQATTRDAGALQAATDAYAREVVRQLRARAAHGGGAVAAAFSHALAATPLGAYARHDFTTLPVEVAWEVFSTLSVDDLAAVSEVNRRGWELTATTLTPGRREAMRWRRLFMAAARLRFHDDLNSERHWGGILQPSPSDPAWFLLAHEHGVEVSQVEGDALVSRRVLPTPRHPSFALKTPVAWDPRGASYAYVSHNDDGACLYLVDLSTGARRALPLAHERINAIAWSPVPPYPLALATPGGVVLVDPNAPWDAPVPVPGTRGESAHAEAIVWHPTRPWLACPDEDNCVQVLDVGNGLARVGRTLDLAFRWDTSVVWHQTRPLLAVTTDRAIEVVPLEASAGRPLSIPIYDAIKFRHSISPGNRYLAWDPRGHDLLAVYCSDEL
ncbi:MAG TPA: hypothetical protein VFH51_17315, partial [Myxococcota bacterium]|nr:hypothetical protein [Myxococcota bacterium]